MGGSRRSRSKGFPENKERVFGGSRKGAPRARIKPQKPREISGGGGVWGGQGGDRGSPKTSLSSFRGFTGGEPQIVEICNLYKNFLQFLLFYSLCLLTKRKFCIIMPSNEQWRS